MSSNCPTIFGTFIIRVSCIRVPTFEPSCLDVMNSFNQFQAFVSSWQDFNAFMSKLLFFYNQNFICLYPEFHVFVSKNLRICVQSFLVLCLGVRAFISEFPCILLHFCEKNSSFAIVPYPTNMDIFFYIRLVKKTNINSNCPTDFCIQVQTFLRSCTDFFCVLLHTFLRLCLNFSSSMSLVMWV